MAQDRPPPAARPLDALGPASPPGESHAVADPGSVVDPGWEHGDPADFRPLIPDRYEVRESEDGRYLWCDEAPRVRVTIDRRHSLSEAEARDLGGRVILLDGVGRFRPLLDNARKLYNLDHHEGCERAFTLATCEQALLLVQSGLELAEGDWTIYANEPDLDTVLAIWCLLNYARLQKLSDEARDVLYPLIRLEGAIDANGPELAEFCGLPRQVWLDTKRRIDSLFAIERAIKGRGEWLTTDPEQLTLEMLQEIDALIYTGSDFSEYTRIDEVYGHVEIGDRRVAVACRDRAGIYEVEKHLRGRWGDQLGIVALEKEPGHFTLRRAVSLADIDLRRAYEELNRLDPAVDGRPPEKQWGGSDSIGGSPRPSGTRLAPRDVLRILGAAYARRSPWQTARQAGRALAWTAAVLAVASAAQLVWPLHPHWWTELASHGTVHLAGLGACLCLAGLALARHASERRLWLFGWRRPAGREWLWVAPLAVLAAVPTRAWVPADAAPTPLGLAGAAVAIAIAALGLEAWFRGLAHGLLVLESRVQRPGGPWFLSAASWTSAGLYAAATLAFSAPWIWALPSSSVSARAQLGAAAVGAGIAGLALAVVRERSLSLWPCVALQALGGAASLAFWLWLAP
jgi:hypothetical protein